MEIIINVRDYSEYPGLRHTSISDDSGEDYYHKILNKKFKEAYEDNKTLVINLDGTAGYPPSFLDEAFGNLVYDFGEKEVNKFMKLISNEEPEIIKFIKERTFPEWERRRESNDEPKITGKHSPWYRLEDGKLVKKR